MDIAAILGSNDVLVVWEFNLGDGFSILLAPDQNHDTCGLRLNTWTTPTTFNTTAFICGPSFYLTIRIVTRPTLFPFNSIMEFQATAILTKIALLSALASAATDGNTQTGEVNGETTAFTGGLAHWFRSLQGRPRHECARHRSHRTMGDVYYEKHRCIRV